LHVFTGLHPCLTRLVEFTKLRVAECKDPFKQLCFLPSASQGLWSLPGVKGYKDPFLAAVLMTKAISWGDAPPSKRLFSSWTIFAIKSKIRKKSDLEIVLCLLKFQTAIHFKLFIWVFPNKIKQNFFPIKPRINLPIHPSISVPFFLNNKCKQWTLILRSGLVFRKLQ
jgi:hypothetical protein